MHTHKFANIGRWFCFALKGEWNFVQAIRYASADSLFLV
jgi:hypothetical protein